MTLSDVLEDWEHISREKKLIILDKIVNFVNYDDSNDDLLYALIDVAAGLEAWDYFGSEGLKI